MVEIQCHQCGENFSPPQCIDTDMYDGEVVCPYCKSFLHVKLVKGKLQKRKLVKKEKVIPPLTAEDLKLINRVQEEEHKVLEEWGQTDDTLPKTSSQKG